MGANKDENFKLSLQTTFYEFVEELVRNHQTEFGHFYSDFQATIINKEGEENYSNVAGECTLYCCIDQV